MTEKTVRFLINGAVAKVNVEPRETLVDTLRLQLGLTGTHVGCEQGICGACTVLIDGKLARSCLYFTVQAEAREVLTIEGISPASTLTPIQASMRRHHAVQCGFCTPGMVIALHHLFKISPTPTDPEIIEALSGQLCRCTGYQPIVAAAKALADSNRLAHLPNNPTSSEA
jgi:carbon-monoxide dehydrogenase small subunit